MTHQPSTPTTHTPPGHPNGGSTTPAKQTETVYGMTVYLKSQRESNPMGIGVKVFAPDPETARSIINGAFGDDISIVSGPVTITEDVYTSPSTVAAAFGGKGPASGQASGQTSGQPSPQAGAQSSAPADTTGTTGSPTQSEHHIFGGGKKH